MVKIYAPLYCRHLSIADTFSENQWSPLLRDFTDLEYCFHGIAISREIDLLLIFGSWLGFVNVVVFAEAAKEK